MASPEDVYNRPADLFVASFTGATNFIPGRVRTQAGEFGTIEAASGHSLTAWLPSGTSTGSEVKIAVRPENVQFGEPVDGPNHFTARVLARRYQGVQTMYELDLLGSTIEAMEVGTAARYAVGADVPVHLPPSICWAYPANAEAAPQH
jgi:iron(III) transport system ATP-binding protein